MNYDYSLSADFDDAINPSALADAINASTITIALVRIDTSGDDVTIVFKAAISSAEETTLDTLVANHDPAPTPDESTKVVIEDVDGKSAYSPVTDKGTPINQPNVVPAGYFFYGTGAFDNIAAGTRGDGAQIVLSRTTAGEDECRGRFLEHVYIIGGYIATNAAGPRS